MKPQTSRCETPGTTQGRDIFKRLSALVGESEALETIEAGNFHLGGKSPQQLIDEGNFRPLEILLAELEAREKSRCDFLTPPAVSDYDEIDHAAADPILDRLPSVKTSRGTQKVLAILDNLSTGKGESC